MEMKDTKTKDFVNSVAALDIVKAVQDHTRYLVYKLFVQKVTNDSIKCARAKEVLTRMCLLYGLCQIN